MSSVIRVKFTVDVIMGSLKNDKSSTFRYRWPVSIDHPSYSHSKKRQAVSYFRKCKNINSKTTRNWEGTLETSATTIIPENESIQFTLGNNKQLLYEAEHDVKNYSDRGYCYPSAKVDKSLQTFYNSSHFRMIV